MKREMVKIQVETFIGLKFDGDTKKKRNIIATILPTTSGMGFVESWKKIDLPYEHHYRQPIE